MNIQQFRYVLAVVDTRNFELAAEKCFVTQSTLSTMIARFEDEIGIKIFNRKTKPVRLTKEGERVIERLRVIINEVEILQNMIQEIKGEAVGDLKIGIIPTLAPYLLPLFLPVFAREYPGIRVITREMTTAQVVDALKKRDIDIGLLAIPVEDEELIQEALFLEPFLVYDCREVKKQKKISVDSLDYSNLWLLEEGHCLRTQVYHICEQSKQSLKNEVPNIEFESGSMDSLMRFTRASKGLTIIPYLAAHEMPTEERNNIVEFKTPVPVRLIGMLTHKFFVKKKLSAALKQTIQDRVSGLLPVSRKTEIISPT